LIQPTSHPTPEPPAEERGPFRALIFGEALFDHFPDGSRALGGAPFNVAWHLQGFKGDPLMVTAVGQDREGQEILERMGDWGMDTTGVQIHPTRPTGRVMAHLDGDQPRYEIEPRQAYDAIRIDELPELDGWRVPTLLYHGSLGVREETSARTLSHLKSHLDLPTFVDVNLRDPWWDRASVSGLLRGSAWVKVNQEEVGLISGNPVSPAAACREAALGLREGLEVGTLVVTLGADGSLAVTDGEVMEEEASGGEETVDTVGAGDAFSAVLALGIHRGWPLGVSLRRASEFAGEICRIRGAVPSEPDLYRRYSERWSRA